MSDSPTPYEIQGWDTGDEHLDISIHVNGFRFTITVSPDYFKDSPRAIGHFREIFDKIEAGNDDSPDVWDYAKQVADIFLPEFEVLAPPRLQSGKLTLADLSIRGSFECQYRVIKEEPMSVAVTERVWDDTLLPAEWDMRSIQSAFPVVDPVEVEIPYSDDDSIYDIIPRQVFIRGWTLFYKPCWSPYDAIDEVEKYSRIYNSGLSTEQLSTARLFGVVAGRGGQAKGLLYEWIETKGAGTLASTISADTPLALRKKWVSQISNAVARLHRLGVVWGDVKPDNVLIDIHNNAIVIDLEGGTTRGWVERDVGDSIEGDLQGIEKLVDFILNDESPLRLGIKITQ
ncbi:hypothetical protein JDV02_009719 [Purpureocillium takamizusanense]|uniref:Protein kinase domain-containing protein n=1 Tax=Purpureocillium takamizusanense TaxID=2060973 RepID=A0A9Q8VGH7_9HYPO|nr:uncharacterized protein JDV02_009719 [Purpureocillium takamizusanense]UNI23929.1 hypothetical protein JDV02_009719 [Purpureocillium takamizusanense]